MVAVGRVPACAKWCDAAAGGSNPAGRHLAASEVIEERAAERQRHGDGVARGVREQPAERARTTLLLCSQLAGERQHSLAAVRLQQPVGWRADRHEELAEQLRCGPLLPTR